MTSRETNLRILIGAIGALVPTLSAVAEPTAEQLDYFERKIRPVLVQQCNECHSAKSKILRGGLLLDSKEGLLKGGDSGPAVVPDKPDESLLLSALRYEGLEMPPEGKLSEEVIADFEKWIQMGAPDPRQGRASLAKPTLDLQAGRQFWAFLSPKRIPVPAMTDSQWPRNDVDRYLLASLEAKNLKPAKDADKRTLVRRAYFDLIGLPPTLPEIETFLRDDSPDAFAKLVDRLLASPHFGERWGRHWLDVARFSETTGGGRSMFFGTAWMYRDYVIQSFNDDKPYDRFIVEQLAGDQLPYEDYRQGQEQIIATAFLAMGPINYEEQDKAQLRMDVIDEQIDTTGRAFLAMTLGCARCHDHKFDPIPTADYYALAGIFGSTKSLIDDNVSTWVTRPLPVDKPTADALAAHQKALTAIAAQIQARKTQLAKLQRSFPVVTLDDKDAKFAGHWSESSSVKPFVGSAYRYASGNASATYDFGKQLEPGRYKVRVSYTAHPNRSRNAVIKVAHGEDVDEFQIDQTQPPPADGLYYELGTFDFTAKSKASITVAGLGPGAVVADAVQLIPLFRRSASAQVGNHIVSDLSELPGIVIDNSAAETVGAWIDSTYVPSYVATGYVHDNNTEKGTKSITFRTDLPRSGDYEVRLSYTHSEDRATRVPVSIIYSGGDKTIYVNQRQPPAADGLFISLGTFPFANDQTAVVTVATTGTEDGHVIADAVQFLPAAAMSETGNGRAKQDSEVSADDLDITAIQGHMATLENELTRMKGEMEELKKGAPPAPPAVMSVEDEAKIADCELCIRGEHKNRGAPIPRGFLTVATTGQMPALSTKRSGRLELAEWIASPQNPLTARVMVNRIWQQLFGEGIVRTVDNFGAPGERPSNPELLDYLAIRFVEQNWSIKSMIREIMLSHAYQLSSQRTPEVKAADPDNRLLSSQNRRRLDVEALYDTLLLLGGNLDLTIGGNTIRPDTKTEYGYSFETGRRALYLPVLRNQMHDMFTVFDFPDPNLSIGRRTTSTLSTQALFLRNSPFVLDQSKRFAERLLADVSLSDEARITSLYEKALSRPPHDPERKLTENYLGQSDLPADVRLSRWSSLCHTLFCSIDFRYVE